MIDTSKLSSGLLFGSLDYIIAIHQLAAMCLWNVIIKNSMKILYV